MSTYRITVITYVCLNVSVNLPIINILKTRATSIFVLMAHELPKCIHGKLNVADSNANITGNIY